MKAKRILFLSVFSACAFTGVYAQPTKQGKVAALSIERHDGQSVVTDLGSNIFLNKLSTLKREEFVITDELAPAVLKGSMGFKVLYKTGERYSTGQYQYSMDYLFIPTEPLSAFEVRVHVFDIFGRFIRTLSSIELADLTEQKLFTPTWRILSENEASEAFLSVAYIAQVRTSSGKVYEIDRAAVLEQVRKVNKRITEAELMPKAEKASQP